MAMRIDFATDPELQIKQAQPAYAFGYGAWPDGTLIYDPLGVHKDANGRYVDRRLAFTKLIRKKAALATTAAIIHTTTDQQIIDTTRRETPMQELIPMETARGYTISYDVLVNRGAASFSLETV